MPPRKVRRPLPPLDPAALERTALRYVERFATTQGKLAAYLRRKARERGWDGGDPGEAVERIVGKFAGLGYVDDAAWTASRARGLLARGLGERRLRLDLNQAGIAPDLADAHAPDEEDAFAAALTLARRKRIGAFGDGHGGDRKLRDKQLAAMLRAGHSPDLARRFVDARPGEVPEFDPLR